MPSAKPAAVRPLATGAVAVVVAARERLGDAEVGHHRAAGREQHVVGLDVAVDEPAGVGVRERARHLAEQAHRVGDRQRAALLEPPAQRFALDERHGEVREAGDLAGREERHDVRVLEAGGEEDLLLEALGAHARGELGGEELDDDAAAEAAVAGEVDAAHAAAAELALELEGGPEGGRQLLGEGSSQRRDPVQERVPKYTPGDTGLPRCRSPERPASTF